MPSIKATLFSLLPLLMQATTAHHRATTSHNATTAPNTTTTVNVTTALKPNCRPGGNFDLSHWYLQLPTGKTNDPTTIQTAQLEGCRTGFQDPNYFYTSSSNGSLIMKVPGSPSSSGCVTTSGSLHCRTELREQNPTSWSPKDATNKLTVTLAVTTPDESPKGTVIGQVHMVSSKPVCELYYNKNGLIQIGVEQEVKGGDEKVTTIGTIPVGNQFTYEISYSSNVLTVSLNGGTPKTLSTFSLDAPLSYFKVGNYNQGNDPSDVQFYSITVEH